MRALPLSREWLAPGLSEPVLDVHTMAGLDNVRRFFVVNDEPLALGFQPIGDALCHANPLLGRGCTYAFVQAYLLKDALAAHSNDLREMALSFDRGIEAESFPATNSFGQGIAVLFETSASYDEVGTHSMSFRRAKRRSGRFSWDAWCATGSSPPCGPISTSCALLRGR